METHERFVVIGGKAVAIPIKTAQQIAEAGKRSVHAQRKWDASDIKQPGWNHVQQAFLDGAREARANPNATEHDFARAADGYTKLVFAAVDPASDDALAGVEGAR